jgi:hypothetical protein
MGTAFFEAEALFFGGEALPFAADFADEALAGAAFFGAAAILGAAPRLFLAAAFFFGSTASTFPFLRAAAGGAAFAFTGAARPVPALAMASSSGYSLVAFSINRMSPVFQEGITKLIAEGLPTPIRTPVWIKVPAVSSIWKTVISSLSWLAT